MSQKNDKKLRRVVNKKVARDNQRVFQEFMLEISAKPFWQRLWWCLCLAFKRHALQRSMKDQIRARKRLLRAQKIAVGQEDNKALKFALGFAYVIVLTGLIIFVGR